MADAPEKGPWADPHSIPGKNLPRRNLRCLALGLHRAIPDRPAPAPWWQHCISRRWRAATLNGLLAKEDLRVFLRTTREVPP